MNLINKIVQCKDCNFWMMGLIKENYLRLRRIVKGKLRISSMLMLKEMLILKGRMLFKLIFRVSMRTSGRGCPLFRGLLSNSINISHNHINHNHIKHNHISHNHTNHNHMQSQIKDNLKSHTQIIQKCNNQL